MPSAGPAPATMPRARALQLAPGRQVSAASSSTSSSFKVLLLLSLLVFGLSGVGDPFVVHADQDRDERLADTRQFLEGQPALVQFSVGHAALEHLADHFADAAWAGPAQRS